MAEPLIPAVSPSVPGLSPPAPASAGASLELLNQAVRLLRQTQLATLLCHWIGSAPLALALLLFRNQVTRPYVPVATLPLSALALTILLLWMNCWRSVFAGRLRRQLSGAADSSWTAQRVFRLIHAQAWFGATKLYVLPMAALVVFPIADTIAFYRIVAVLADRDDLDALQLRSRARQLAGARQGENWTILPILFFLQILVAINLTLVLFLLPQLFRILTGIETAFSRSGLFFMENPLFPFLVLAISWLALDPFVQAVYCVRCFRAESIETGEDIRAGLRLIRAAAQVMAACILFLIAVPGRAAVTPQELDQAIKQAAQSHEYDWRLPPATSARASKESWIIDATDRAMLAMRSVTRFIGKAIRAFFEWLGRQLGSAGEPGSGAPPAHALHWSVYLLIGCLLVAALWIAWQKRRAQRIKAPGAAPALSAVHLDDEALTPDRLPEEQWLEMAARCLADQDFRRALRAYYLANLAWLGRTEFLAIHPGKTNREYEIEFRRKTRGFAEAHTLLAANVTAFERAWYGLRPVTLEDIDEFRSRLGRMKAALTPSQEAAA